MKVFPCSHAIHLICVERLDKQSQICPFDRRSIISAKITYVGETIFFNYKENLFFFHLFEKYKSLFITYFEREAKRREAFSAEGEKEVKRGMMGALRTFVDDYARGHQENKRILPLSWDNFERILLFLQEKGEIDLSCNNPEFWFVDAICGGGGDIGEDGMVDQSLKRLLNGISSSSREGVRHLERSIDSSLRNWRLEPIEGSTRFKPFAERINQLFYQSHCQSLEKLSTPEEYKAYLNKMYFYRASRLKELSLANHTPVKIQEKVNAIFNDCVARRARQQRLIVASFLFIVVVMTFLDFFPDFSPVPHQS